MKEQPKNTAGELPEENRYFTVLLTLNIGQHHARYRSLNSSNQLR